MPASLFSISMEFWSLGVIIGCNILSVISCGKRDRDSNVRVDSTCQDPEKSKESSKRSM